MRTEISDILFNIETEYDVSLTDISREKYCKTTGTEGKCRSHCTAEGER